MSKTISCLAPRTPQASNCSISAKLDGLEIGIVLLGTESASTLFSHCAMLSHSRVIARRSPGYLLDTRGCFFNC